MIIQLNINNARAAIEQQKNTYINNNTTGIVSLLPDDNRQNALRTLGSMLLALDHTPIDTADGRVQLSNACIDFANDFHTIWPDNTNQSVNDIKTKIQTLLHSLQPSEE